MDVSRQSICLCKVSALPTVSTQPIVITHCLTVSEDLTWELYVHNCQVQPHICQTLQSVPQILTSDPLSKLLQLLDRLKLVCVVVSRILILFQWSKQRKGKLSPAMVKLLLVLISTLSMENIIRLQYKRVHVKW